MAKNINETFSDYACDTFRIKDEEFQRLYQDEVKKMEFSKGPYLDCVDAFEKGKSLKELVEEGILNSDYVALFAQEPHLYERPLYRHQEQAIRAVQSGKNVVVTTGTGSGKTECFLYPILNALMEEKEKGTLCPGARALLLYPMNALANDQMKRLRSLLATYPDITFGAYTGETQEYESKAKELFLQAYGKPHLPNELISRETIRETPPHLLITNYVMLEYLMLRPNDNVFFDGPYAHHWKFFVLDEAHTYAGAIGMEVSMLLRRVYYKIQPHDHIQFILTSATLGGTDRNKDIRAFASDLCAGQPFQDDAIIRASRMVLQEPPETKSSPLSVFNELASAIDTYDSDKETGTKRIQDVIGQSDLPVHQAVYDRLQQEHLYYLVREQLHEQPKTIKDLAERLKITSSDVIDFVTCATFAQKDGTKLLDARYHHFIRTLQGAYVTFQPQKTLSLIPRTQALFDDIPYVCFQLSVCQFCGAIYLVGKNRGGVLSQERTDNPDYFLVVDDRDFIDKRHQENKEEQKKEDIRERAFFLNCQNGKLLGYQKRNPSPQEIIVLECKGGEDGQLHMCEACNTRSPRATGILQGFYLGEESASSVVCESLYESLPEVTIEQPQTNSSSFFGFRKPQPVHTRRLLSFADSRQEAAYFASYFQYTHDVIRNRRYLIQAILQAENTHLSVVMHKLGDLLAKSVGVQEPKKEAARVMLSEFKNFSRNDLMNLGWVRYSFDQKVYEQGNTNPTISFDGTTITGKQFNAAIDAFLLFCLRHGAIAYDASITFSKEDFASFSFASLRPVVASCDEGTGYSSVDPRFLTPKEVYQKNSFIDYLEKIGIPPDKCATFAKELFVYLKTEEEVLAPCQEDRTTFVVKPESIQVQVQTEKEGFPIYQCDVCGRMTSLDYEGVCPTYHCKGHLQRINFHDRLQEDYFVRKYAPEEKPLLLVVKEHTGQLSKSHAREYQQQFLQGKINMLSCSTTFEMGVDVGDLETVFMKNMPPKPSNYIQRAGRAGRRVESAAFALTFCRLAAHDFHFFNNPMEMIKGQIDPPHFKIDNEKIVRRHVYAVLLSLYWKHYPDAKTVNDLFQEEGVFPEIETYLSEVRETPEVLQYLQEIVPTEPLRRKIDSFIQEYQQSDLRNVKDLYCNELADLAAARDEVVQRSRSSDHAPGIGGQVKFLIDSIHTYQEQHIIDFYSRKNLLPKYGFPVDTVELETSNNGRFDNNKTLSLQRDLIQAITDYAPDSEVIADGHIYRSRYILKPRAADKTWEIRKIEICSQCGYIKDTGIAKQLSWDPNQNCPNCGTVKAVETYHVLLPVDGFAIENGENEIATTRKPKKSKRSEIYYLGGMNEEKDVQTKTQTLNGVKIKLISSPNDKLFVMNKAVFKVCQTCGYAFSIDSRKGAPDAHKTRLGKDCHGHFSTYKLGHEFLTDVVVLHFPFDYIGSEQAITLLYTLLEGCSRYFTVERDDIDGCVSYDRYVQGEPFGFNIILFDSVPGGAGNVKRVFDASEEAFKGFLNESYHVVKDCTCGDNGDGNTVCYNCLCNYHNQYYHDKMKRNYAIKLLEPLL